MKKQKTEVDYDIQPLDKSIEWITLFNKVNSMDTYIKKMVNKYLIEGVKELFPILLFIIALTSPIVTIKLICFGLTVVTTVNKIRNEIKKVDKDENDEEINISKSMDDYYTESFKKIEVEELESNLKYEAALEKQRKKNNSQFYLTYKKPYLKKEETINFMTSMIELYYISYKLPELNVENKEWDIFYDSLYENVERLELEKEYNEICKTIIMYTLSKSMVNNQEEIKIEDFVKTMELLENKYGIVQLGFTKRKILDIQKDILSKLSKLKVVNILSFKNNKTLD